MRKMAYPYYQNNQFYMQDLQNMREKIDRQMQNIQQAQNQQPVQQPITQNFQLAPNPTNNELESKYVNNIDEVKNTFVIKTGVFVNKDFTTLWVKDVTGNIRTFNTEEIIELDPKDKEILDLKKQIQDMKEMMSNATQYDNTDVNESVEKQTTKRVPTAKRTNAK